MITHNKTNLYKRIAVSFLATSVVIALAIFYLAFSWASITVVPKSDDFSASYSVDVVDTDAGNPGAAVPGKVIEQTLDADGSFSATGSATELQQAEGTVTILNTTGKAQQLRATTRILSANGTLFRTKEYVNVLPESQIEVAVVADKPGDVGEVSSHLTIPGLSEGQQAKIYAQSYVPKAAGTSNNKIVSSEDIQKAEDALVARLQESFTATLNKSGSGLAGTSIGKVVDHTVVSSTSSANVGDKAEQFDMKVKVRFDAVLFNEDTMRAHVANLLKERLAPGQELIAPKANEIHYVFDRIDPSRNTATIKVVATAGKILAQDARVFDRERLVGLSKEEIQAYFATSSDIQGVEVKFYPFWVLRAPLLPDHINILIKK